MPNPESSPILGAPYTFCMHGYPMQYDSKQKLQCDGDNSISMENSIEIEFNGQHIRILDLETAIAYHAKGNTFEILQAMTMILRSANILDLDKLDITAKKLNTERHVGFLLTVCSMLFDLKLQPNKQRINYSNLVILPVSFKEIFESNRLYLPSESFDRIFCRSKDDPISMIGATWGCECLLSDEELLKPLEFQKYLTPNFAPLIDTDLMYSDLFKVIDYLQEHGIQYLISGGLAIAELAFPRTSLDADIAVDQMLCKSTHDGLIAMAESNGLTVGTDNGEDLVMERREKSSVLHSIDICMNSIYDRIIPKSMFAAPVIVTLAKFNRSIRFMSIPDLVSLRLGTGRCKAIEDAQKLTKMGLIHWPSILGAMSESHLEQAKRDLLLAAPEQFAGLNVTTI